MRSEEKRQEARGKKHQHQRKGRRGRTKTKDKIAQAERTERVFPEGIAAEKCRLSHVPRVTPAKPAQSVGAR